MQGSPFPPGYYMEGKVTSCRVLAFASGVNASASSSLSGTSTRRDIPAISCLSFHKGLRLVAGEWQWLHAFRRRVLRAWFAVLVTLSALARAQHSCVCLS